MHDVDGLAQRVDRGFAAAALGAPARMKFYPFPATLSTGLRRASRNRAQFDNAERRRL
jgi:hypothetical protein